MTVRWKEAWSRGPKTSRESPVYKSCADKAAPERRLGNHTCLGSSNGDYFVQITRLLPASLHFSLPSPAVFTCYALTMGNPPQYGTENRAHFSENISKEKEDEALCYLSSTL